MIYYGIRDLRGIMWQRGWKAFKPKGLPALYRRRYDAERRVKSLDYFTGKQWAKDEDIYGRAPFEVVEVLATILPVKI